MQIRGISHLTFIVRNLERSSKIFTDVFGGREVYSSGDQTFSLSREKFFMVDNIWIALMEGESLPNRTYNHVAFKVNARDLHRYQQAIAKLGLDVRAPRSRVKGEGESIYFFDFDNHLFELHSGTLRQRLKRYSNVHLIS
jgi:fosfomycin resistance protein FosX